MPRDAVSRTANVERTGRHKWVNTLHSIVTLGSSIYLLLNETKKLVGSLVPDYLLSVLLYFS